MARVTLPITNGFYVSRSLPISNQECVNFYVHINQKGGLAPESLFGTPGLNQLATSGTDAQINRGVHVKGDIPYFVNGSTLYRLNQVFDGLGNESFNLESLGTIPGTGRVSMADNGAQLCILVPGGQGFIFNEDAGTPFQEITDPDFTANGAPQHVAFVDGFFLFTTDEKKFIISNLNDGLAYTATDFGTAEADPDAIVAPIVNNGQVYICGTETIERFYNNAANTGAAFPFTRITGGGLSVGVFAAFSLINVSGSFFFIGGATNESPSVYQFEGGGVTIVSDDGINVLLEELTESELSDVFAFSYSENGARFVGWTLPTTTIVYDITSGRWHERKTLQIINGVASEARWRVNGIVKGYSRILCSDNADGRVGELKLDIFDEYGQNIVSRISTLPFANRGERILVPMIEMTLESGVGNADDPDPLIWLERSVDGKKWSDQVIRRAGKIGENEHRAIWRRLGRAARFELFRFTMSDKVKKVLIKLEGDIV